MSLLYRRRALVLSVLTLVFAGYASAQESTPALAGGSGKYHVKTMVFNLPFKIDPRTQMQVQEMQLWGCDDKANWQIMDRVAPTASCFTCRVPRDGEYGFSIVTLDRQGKLTPGDVTRKPAELIVVVSSGRETANVPPSVPSDLIAVKAEEISESKSPQAKAPDKKPAPAAAPSPRAPRTIENLAAESVSVASENSTSLEVENTSAAPELPLPATTTAPRTVSSNASNVVLINSTQVSIDYNVERKGPTGVSKVEIYGTTDGGLSWKRFCEDADRRSPAEVRLPGEGTFGLRLVGFNGNGFGRPPSPGAQPLTTVEVDLTKPKIQTWKVMPVKNGKLEIHWKTIDKNLGATPVNLFYSQERNGAWKPLVKRQPAEGTYHGSIPADIAEQIHLRLEVVDLAGNVSRCETPNPLTLDRTEPDISVVGVTITPRSMDAGNNLIPVSGVMDSQD